MHVKYKEDLVYSPRLRTQVQQRREYIDDRQVPDGNANINTDYSMLNQSNREIMENLRKNILQAGRRIERITQQVRVIDYEGS